MRRIAALAKEVVSDERKMAGCHRRPTEEEVRGIFEKVLR
jgi:hypothetical protein